MCLLLAVINIEYSLNVEPSVNIWLLKIKSFSMSVGTVDTITNIISPYMNSTFHSNLINS